MMCENSGGTNRRMREAGAPAWVGARDGGSKREATKNVQHAGSNVVTHRSTSWADAYLTSLADGKRCCHERTCTCTEGGQEIKRDIFLAILHILDARGHNSTQFGKRLDVLISPATARTHAAAVLDCAVLLCAASYKPPLCETEATRGAFAAVMCGNPGGANGRAAQSGGANARLQKRSAPRVAGVTPTQRSTIVVLAGPNMAKMLNELR